MNFLNIGSSELMLIIILAILLVGPKRMIEISRMLGRALGKLRKISGEFKTIIQRELRDTEAGAQQLADGSLVGEAGVGGELSTTGGQLKSTVEGLPEEIGLASLQAELRETERATRKFLERVSGEPDDESERPAAARSARATQGAAQAGTAEAPETAETETAQAETEASGPQPEPQEAERATRKFLERASTETDTGEEHAKIDQAAQVAEAETGPAGQTDAVQAEQEKADGNDPEA